MLQSPSLAATAATIVSARRRAGEQGARLAPELIDSGYADPAAVSFAESLADGVLNQRLFIGPQVDDEQTRAPLYWLAEFLRSTAQQPAIRYGDLGVLTMRFSQK